MIEPQMNAVRLHAPGQPAQLAYERIPIPRPGLGEVLVPSHAAAITRDELEWPEDRLMASAAIAFGAERSRDLAKRRATARDVND